MEVKFETEKKEKQIAEQNLEIAKSRSNTRLLGGGIIATLIIGGLMLWFLTRQSRIQSALQTAEIQSLKQENKIIALQGIMNGQEEERRRIAQDLHDNIGTLMSTIKMKVLSIQKGIADIAQINIAGEIDEMVNQASTEIRRISHNMTPVAMELTGLEGAVEDLSEQLRSEGIETECSLAGLDQIKDKEKAVIVYRLIQEIVTNITKHSNAHSAFIRTELVDEKLHLTIRDDGQGIPTEAWNTRSGLGLKSINLRVEYLEGSIELDGSNGTSYKIEIPT